MINQSLQETSDQFKYTADENKFISGVWERLKLPFIGAGMSRFVFRIPKKKLVYKYNPTGAYNWAEYCLYQGVKNTVLEPLLAESLEISPDGTLLLQKFVRKQLPADDHLRDEKIEFQDLVNELERPFGFLGAVTGSNKLIFDFHEGNLRLDNDGTVKIVDYAAPLHSICNLSSFKAQKVIKEIHSRARNKRNKVYLYFNIQRELVLESGQKILKATKDSPSNGENMAF